jgi:glycine/D-amino acid oxidase-like deaminating enzyme
LAGVAARQGNAERAARLFGAAEELNEAIQDPPPPAQRREIEQNMATAQSQLEAARWEAAWAEGRAMTLEQAVAYALEPMAKFP